MININRLIDLEICGTFTEVDETLDKILGSRCNMHDKLDFMYEYLGTNCHPVEYTTVESKYEWIVNIFLNNKKD